MTATSFNISLSERHDIVRHLNDETFRKLIPSITFCCILSITGTVGNILSIYIFMASLRNNPQNDLFILLSIVNLVACGVCLPLEVLDMRNMYMQPSIVVCKVGRFLNVFTMLASTLTLSTLAILRLRAALCGTAVNTKRSSSVAGIVLLLLVSASISWIAVIVFGLRSSLTFIGDIVGQDCSVADSVNNTAWPTVFNVIFFTGFAILIAVTVISYYQIWRIVKKSRIAVTSHAATISTIPCPYGCLETEHSNICGKDPANSDSDIRNLNKIEENCGKSGLLVAHRDDLMQTLDGGEETGTIDVGLKDKKIVTLLSISGKESRSQLLDTDSSTGTSNDSKYNRSTDAVSALATISIASSYKDYKMTYDQAKVGLEKCTKVLADDVINNCHSYKNVWRITYKKQLSHMQQKAHSHTTATTSNPQLASLAKKLSEHTTSSNRTTEKDFTSTNSAQRKLSEGSDQHAVKRELKPKLPKTSLESAITRTAFLLTVTFVISYVPFFLVSIPRTINKNIDYSQDDVKINLINIAVRLYFIMPTISPVIFWASNLDFRRRCRALCHKDISYTV